MKDWLRKIYDESLRDFGGLSDDKIMALTIYAESRGESRQGKIAVGSVILERVDHRSWDGDTIQEVCLWPLQFSCYNPADPNRPMLKNISGTWEEEIIKNKTLQECLEISQGLISGYIERYPKALDYFNPSVCQPAWEKEKTFVAEIGHHKFFV